MDLFEYSGSMSREKESPLASRMRPTSLDEIVGQQDIIGKDKMLYRAIKADRLSSVIFYGPPGTGKTTLAKVIANSTSCEFRSINATCAGKKDMEEVVDEAKKTFGGYGKRTILFIDEIHRFNKGQQDFLLPFVEDGTIVLIGATTENPYFEVNSALISRSLIFELHPLSKEDIKTLISRAVTDRSKGLGGFNLEMTDEALDFIADAANGDARNALNAIELAALTTSKGDDGKVHVDLEVAAECIRKRAINYDKNGDSHYDTISAFIKSMRGSDPDAAVYYLARMLYAGEDIKFIARRIMICAAEDVSLADPNALTVAVAAAEGDSGVGVMEVLACHVDDVIASARPDFGEQCNSALFCGVFWKWCEDVVCEDGVVVIGEHEKGRSVGAFIDAVEAVHAVHGERLARVHVGRDISAPPSACGFREEDGRGLDGGCVKHGGFWFYCCNILIFKWF